MNTMTQNPPEPSLTGHSDPAAGSVPIDLLPAIVSLLGDGMADVGLEHGGWVLQRLGDPPVRDDLSAAVLSLHDSYAAHVRPGADQLPPFDFDDPIKASPLGSPGPSARHGAAEGVIG